MGYFRELPNLLFQSPYPTKKSTGDYIAITNIFRRAKIFESLQNNVFVFDKYVIGLYGFILLLDCVEFFNRFHTGMNLFV